MTNDPRQIYSYLRRSRKSRTTKIDKLVVESKVYEGPAVADGFFDSMTSLKSCNFESLLYDPNLSQQFSNYKHILKICNDNKTVPPIQLDKAAHILNRNLL